MSLETAEMDGSCVARAFNGELKDAGVLSMY